MMKFLCRVTLLLPWVQFVAQANPMGLKEAKGTRSWLRKRSRSLTSSGSRVSAFNTNELKCNRGYQEGGNNTIQGVDFYYWYAMGVAPEEQVNNTEMKALELTLFKAIKYKLVWCFQETSAASEFSVSHNSTTQSNGGRKLFSELGNGQVRYSKEARGLDILAYTTGNLDTQTKFACPSSLENYMKSKGAGSCVMVKGDMRIVAYTCDDLAFAIAGTRDGIQQTMKEDYRNGVPSSPEIVSLFYIGDTESEVFYEVPVTSDDQINGGNGSGDDGEGSGSGGQNVTSGSNSTGANAGGPGGQGQNSTVGEGNYSQVSNDTALYGNETGSDRGVIAPIVESQSTSSERDRGILGILFGIGIALLIVIVLLLMFVQTKKRSKSTIIVAPDLKGNSPMSRLGLTGTGDPPGSFHEGAYHYTKAGRRYLSTRCEDCLETRRNSFYPAYNLATILEDQVYEDDAFFNTLALKSQKKSKVVSGSSDSGKEAATGTGKIIGQTDASRGTADGPFGGPIFVGNDVHVCTSATCLVCSPISKGPKFIEAEKDWVLQTLQMEDFQEDFIHTFPNVKMSSMAGHKEV